jgi:hypothetical protein
MHFGRVPLCPVQNTSGLDNTMRLLFDIGDKSYCREIVNSWAGKPGKEHNLSKMRWTRGMQPNIACVRTSGAARRVRAQTDDTRFLGVNPGSVMHWTIRRARFLGLVPRSVQLDL